MKSYAFKGLTVKQIMGRAAEYVKQIATTCPETGELIQPSRNEYDRCRPETVPASATLRHTYSLLWNDIVAAAGFQPRRKDRKGAATAIPVTLVFGDEPLTGNISSDDEDEPPLCEIPPARTLAEIEADPTYAGLPTPQRDPLTGRYASPRDLHGLPVPRVRVAKDECTCRVCGQTFGARGNSTIAEVAGLCPICNVEEAASTRRRRPRASVETLAYLQPGEYEPAY